ncbi:MULTISPECIES: tRNA (adenosine(37)-N6)-threonylcarbamoyltransferase complex ATPase subunit type 1 TsaE [unclassified Synechococcus]|uniref:tRNA (adenosine(37)-N6)-threonylcarbamoyltransferase complex ATPase subunit type 1 TsaE n=1 Tax=unclassified Synechococcus TaxID=2626047 RepID=UPI0018CD4D4F|nr:MULTISPECIES: tRNA (adenosine(37)-N6)-threonylcarbamoyltransferase complex ATPase subunit type 1 TsaE [unclassified Synechococcus]MEA5421786.1 tRNA (adenosine(37)-N6)-threonylcarbamoyltransferase complex ATPase subunit type 1 TsaE [Synechococcus sp. CCY9202]QPN67366.1 tRNA (adenosine(37)-N6)-threonylcarbamoyltransferase complex ATPase subunit type 1 TsaE [Synechococcus sp. CBW1006]CAK6702041.1 tRNA threonylcarbamoyladenosine biosynthesis protein TsaE [Synechococcus sp. CBW1107]
MPDPVLLRDLAATRALGRALVRQLAAPAPILLLQGELGAGKTSLVQGLAEGLGISEPITSPSFALAQHYAGQGEAGATALVHLDLYRLEPPAAADELFAQEEEEARSLGALLAVEWPERLSQLPAEAWRLQLELADPADPEQGRIARLIAP